MKNNNLKNKLLIIAIIVFIILITGIGSFAFLNQKDKTLDNWHIYFANLQTSISNGNVIVPENPILEATSIKTYDILFQNPGDSLTYTFDVINDGSLDAKLATLTKLNPVCISIEVPENTNDARIVCDNLDYSLVYTKTGEEVKLNDVLKSHTTENLTLQIAYNANIDELPQGKVQVTILDLTLVYNQNN